MLPPAISSALAMKKLVEEKLQAGMDVHAKIASHLIGLFMLLLLDTISTVLGCEIMPAGQGPSPSLGSLCLLPWFTVKTQQLPPCSGAQGFVQRLVMQTVLDVLERQARRAFLPDAVISTILDQLTVNIRYEPLNCPSAANPADETVTDANSPSCNIVDNTVTSICTVQGHVNKKCEATTAEVTVMPISGAPLTISGTLSTTNIIMAKWSNMMWQNVLNRALRMLASGPFASHFSTAFGSIGGN
ncbi:hypothetical protein KIN20_008096 [Parelaphostrongylus tenuis]|uniref:Uncharacterized protein n=1 Tax=Parelaphostrongylus tenuis TaxID=148309 RepID=A0AAD5MQM5_PARTN|nr:hypothetical protein KIN20_008096 [Parelaphostrongylus tenuis]